MLSLLSLAVASSLTAAKAPSPKTTAQLFQQVRNCVFEVVLLKRIDTGATYAEHLPLEKLSFQERTDSVWSIGSAFAVGRDTVLTASHVLNLGTNDPSEEPRLRDAQGRVWRIGKILKYSNHQDFALFTVPGLDCKKPIRPAAKPEIGHAVHAVGNALGEGIVLRDGLLTSQTPEQNNGEWKYWRFSAAASPGNSGGPLLDEQGALVGVVLMKSESENLNFALPWSLVKAAKPGRGRFFENSNYTYPLMPDAELATVLDTTFDLPSSWKDLDHLVWAISTSKTAHDRDSILRAERANVFPRGRSNRLRTGPLFSRIPAMIYRSQDGWWGLDVQDLANPVDLGSNGTWVQNNSNGILLGSVKLPDSIGLPEIVHDSRVLGDLILKGGRLNRKVATKEIRVTSLGKATIDSQRVDPWGRVWLVRGWRQPWNGAILLAQILPVPSGFGIILGVYSEATARSYIGVRLQDMADGSALAWSGTFERWNAWIAQPDIVPTFLRPIRLERKNDIPVFSWPGGTLRLSPAMAPISASPELLISPAFLDVRSDSVIMGIGSVALSPNAEGSALSMLVRVAPPSSDQSVDAKAEWRKRIEQRAPFDGKLIDGGQSKRQASRLIPSSLKTGSADPAQSSPVWMSIIVMDDAPTQSRMDKILDETLRYVKVPEEKVLAP